MANQIIIDIGAAANDGTGDPLRTAFNYVNENFTTIWDTGVANSNVIFSGNRILTVNTNGNLVLAPNGTGKVQANVDIIPNANNTHSLGSGSLRWNTVYAQNLDVGGNTTFGDLTTSNLTVEGNLTVDGDIIQIGNIVTDSKTIQLANTAGTDAAANGSGITVGASDDIATLLYNSTGDVWTTNIGVTAVGNITGTYFIGNGSLLTGITSYGNANVAAYLANTTISIATTGNISGNLLSGNVLNINDGTNFWSINSQTISGPGGSTLISDPTSKDLSLGSGADGYLSLTSLYANSSVAVQWALEHNQARLFVNNGTDQEWIFDVNGVLTTPGDILPNTSNVYSLGSASRQWADLWVSNSTIYMNSVPITLGVGNVLTVAGQPVLTNDSNTTITTTGNITANYFFGNIEGLTGNITNLDSVNFAVENIGALVGNNGVNIGAGGFNNLLVLPTEVLIQNVPLTVAGNISSTVAGGLNITANTVANGTAQIWNFGTDGRLTFPGTPRIDTDANNFEVQAAENISFEANAVVNIYTDTSGTTYQWQFGDDGNLTLPGNIKGSGASPAPSINGFNSINSLIVSASGNVTGGNILTGGIVSATGNVTGNYFIGNGSQLTGLSISSISNGTSNVSIATANGNATITANAVTYTFGTDSTLTLPGGSRLRPLGANLDIFAGTGSYVNLITSDESSYMGVGGAGGYVVTAGGTWDFNTNGNLTAPGNVSAVGNVTGGNLITAGNVSGNTAGYAIGYRDIPQVSFTGNATIATTDAGKHFYSTQSSNYTLTIANNASQGFQVGAAITVVNQGTGNITIAEGSGVTLYLAGNATAGNRSVATFGMATIMKVATDTWFISGAGVA